MPDHLSTEPDSTINPSKIVWWLLSTITAILLIAASAWATSLASHQQTLEDRQTMLDQRLSVIEGKLDIILERSQR